MSPPHTKPYLHRRSQEKNDEIFVGQAVGDHRLTTGRCPIVVSSGPVTECEHEDHHHDHGGHPEDEGEQEGGPPLPSLHLDHVHFVSTATAVKKSSLEADSL